MKRPDFSKKAESLRSFFTGKRSSSSKSTVRSVESKSQHAGPSSAGGGSYTPAEYIVTSPQPTILDAGSTHNSSQVDHASVFNATQILEPIGGGAIVYGTQQISGAASPFAGASNFVMKDANLYNHTEVNQHVHVYTQPENSNHTAVAQDDYKAEFGLEKRKVLGAGFDSVERDPPPRCHPDTRLELRGRLEQLVNQFGSTRRRYNLIWLSGPAGAGKSAVAQTFAEYCNDLHLLGASFFFSRVSGRQERIQPDRLVPTIAYQLCIRYPSYKHLLNQFLQSERGSVFDTTISTQFNKLIVAPFHELVKRNLISHTKPIVIIIDGLDECDNTYAQCQLVKLIDDYVNKSTLPSPILWLLCSRPESHIKRAFASRYLSTPGLDLVYERKEITCNAEEDIADVYCILKAKLQDVRDEADRRLSSRYRASQPWPRESQLQQLSRKVGGLPVLADVVVRFIGDRRGSPNDRLNLCLFFLEDDNASAVVKENPLSALDNLYKYIMDQIPTCMLKTTKQILAICLLLLLPTTSWRAKPYTTIDIAVLLRLDKDKFYLALENLHSVLEIPEFDQAHEDLPKFFHKSFGDYLLDRNRSGDYSVDLDEIRSEIAMIAIDKYDHILSKRECKLQKESKCKPEEDKFEDLYADWSSDFGVQPETIESQLYDFVRSNFWGLLCVGDARRAELIAKLRTFSFCHLPFVPINDKEDRGLPKFMAWMAASKGSPDVDDFIRFKPVSETDKLLLDQCNSKPPLRDQFPNDVGRDYRYNYSFITTHKPSREYSDVPQPSTLAFWIGEGALAALGLLY